MSVDCFLDTNVLVYAAAGRGAEEAKRKRALQLIENEDFGLSAQVLQEFYVTASKDRSGAVRRLEAFPCVAIDDALVKIAAEISERYQIFSEPP